jgi:hypothetical protein
MKTITLLTLCNFTLRNFAASCGPLAAIAICITVLGFLPHAAVSQQNAAQGVKHIEITVSTPFEPVNAVGLLFSERGTVQQPVPPPRRVDESNIIVRVPYRDDLPRDTMAVGAVRQVFSPDPKESFLSIPDCVPERITEATIQNQMSAIESLVQIRSKRRGLAQVQVAQLMSDKFLERLKKLEKGFGLQYQTELAPDLPPVQLIDRLQRILLAIQAVKGNTGGK